jgi:hypothetical protein
MRPHTGTELWASRPLSGNPLRWSRRLVLLAAIALGSGVLLSGCDEYGEHGEHHSPDWRAPAAPQGLRSVTGDEEVRLYWYANTEDDLDGYKIYRSTEPRGYFPRIASVGRHATEFIDDEVENGVTYYYAIAAYDRSGNESELSDNTVYDTPRPEGYSLRLSNANREPDESGYDFSARSTANCHNLDADIYYWQTEQDGAWMIATDRSETEFTDIQDAGYVSLDQIDVAPSSGWAPNGEVELIVGHSYIVWTWDNHYAKFRVVDLNPNRVLVDWAYQLDRGNPELLAHPALKSVPSTRGSQRTHQRGMERRNAS